MRLRKSLIQLGVAIAVIVSGGVSATTSPVENTDGFPDRGLFESRDLHPDFLRALDSNAPAVIAKGYAAWQQCAGYVALGTGTIEGHIESVIPVGIAPAEKERRARYIQLAAEKCRGFETRGDLSQQAEGLRQQLVKSGNLREVMMQELLRSNQPGYDPTRLLERACDVLTNDVPFSWAVRATTPALRSASQRRADHILNRYPDRVSGIAVNLAMCDLHEEGCSLARSRGNWIGSICVQRGRCGYRDELDYWAGETPPDVLEKAQPLRRQLVDAYKRRDCELLF